ncbi:hypothetical protein DL769_005365 [Monosporascus sp. CRB-8-3]|nr:hypothetical protein DL769_005365 [Monosporascus sp. CRB-8-3]
MHRRDQQCEAVTELQQIPREVWVTWRQRDWAGFETSGDNERLTGHEATVPPVIQPRMLRIRSHGQTLLRRSRVRAGAITPVSIVFAAASCLLYFKVMVLMDVAEADWGRSWIRSYNGVRLRRRIDAWAVMLQDSAPSWSAFVAHRGEHKLKNPLGSSITRGRRTPNSGVGPSLQPFCGLEINEGDLAKSATRHPVSRDQTVPKPRFSFSQAMALKDHTHLNEGLVPISSVVGDSD